MQRKYRRALVAVFSAAGVIGVVFDAVGVVQYVLQNALWGGAPGAGGWWFSQGAWWLGICVTGLLIWLAAKGWGRGETNPGE